MGHILIWQLLNGHILIGARLKRADLSRAHLDGADIRYARGIKNIYLDEKTNIRNTIVTPEQREILLEKLGPRFKVRY